MQVMFYWLRLIILYNWDKEQIEIIKIMDITDKNYLYSSGWSSEMLEVFRIQACDWSVVTNNPVCLNLKPSLFLGIFKWGVDKHVTNRDNQGSCNHSQGVKENNLLAQEMWNSLLEGDNLHNCLLDTLLEDEGEKDKCDLVVVAFLAESNWSLQES